MALLSGTPLPHFQPLPPLTTIQGLHKVPSLFLHLCFPMGLYFALPCPLLMPLSDHSC